jgi:hypothetical protein
VKKGKNAPSSPSSIWSFRVSTIFKFFICSKHMICDIEMNYTIRNPKWIPVYMNLLFENIFQTVKIIRILLHIFLCASGHFMFAHKLRKKYYVVMPK